MVAASCCGHFWASMQGLRAYWWLLFSPLVTRLSRCPRTVRPYDPNLVPPAAATLPPQLLFPKVPLTSAWLPSPSSSQPCPLTYWPMASSQLHRLSSPRQQWRGRRGDFSPINHPGEPRSGRLELVAAGSPRGLGGKMAPEALCTGQGRRAEPALPPQLWCRVTNLWGKGVARPLAPVFTCEGGMPLHVIRLRFAM